MLRTALLAAAILAGAPACKKEEPTPPAPVADATPPDLAKPPPVQSAMWSLAVHSNAVVVLLEKGAELSPEEIAQIKQRVDDIGKIANGLGVDPVGKKHPLVKKGLSDFQKAVTAAQAGLAKDPADLAAVRSLVASCRECHARGEPPKPPFNL